MRAGADIHDRFITMKGYDVFEPMGFDAFGIHTDVQLSSHYQHRAISLLLIVTPNLDQESK
jgi:valyl-tRNA synthetase